MLHLIYVKKKINTSIIKRFTGNTLSTDDLMLKTLTTENLADLLEDHRMISLTEHIYAPYTFDLLSSSLEKSFEYYLYTENSKHEPLASPKYRFSYRSPYLSYIYNSLLDKKDIGKLELNDTDDTNINIVFFIHDCKYTITEYLDQGKIIISYIDNQYTLPLNNSYRDVPKSDVGTVIMFGSDVRESNKYEIIDYIDYRIYFAHCNSSVAAPIFSVSTLCVLSRKRFQHSAFIYTENVSIVARNDNTYMAIHANPLFVEVYVYDNVDEDLPISMQKNKLAEQLSLTVGPELDTYIANIFRDLSHNDLLNIL
ncbi:hypothetical protein [Candidatus Epulonipiscium viviparus]|uniref:hypothetical protein n=1 Tax=Candidatus Epulonipiscium viviparus TaxID=420336 RepID=UPI0027380B78|nr:hypothetical protein [Candidatus Epulopiscium viviparus]